MQKVTRLFSTLKPKHYTLSLLINKEKMTFSGTVLVEAHKLKPSKRITLHQKDIKITSATITRNDKGGSKSIPVVRINHHGSFDEVRLHTDETLFPGSYTITAEFSGEITPQMNGIYPCNFKENGVEKKLIATQFESHHAREAFPCIDEPEAKATFDLTLTTEFGEESISNTPVLSEDVVFDESGKKMLRTRFHTTPIMSTYLLAFVTGELKYKETHTKSGILVRAYATAENIGFTDFALNFAARTLDFYESYFEIEYPLKKCDMIALPDFASGAMENWGCITYREACMLVDPANTSLSGKQYVAMVVAHELAHQWFGNLVTMKWWTDLWLNEGFASWVEFLAVDDAFPEWEMWNQFNVEEQQVAKRLDSLENTHPVEVTVNNPDEIRSIFDAISYHKGSSVIHMLENYLGAEEFRKGLVFYLKKHSYGNTVTKDLWQALEETSKKPVKKFMHAWTSQSGFPIVKVRRLDSHLDLEQHRFISHTTIGSQPKEELWPIPLLSNIPLAKDLMTGRAQRLNLKKGTSTPLLNFGGRGFYRTIYDDKTYLELSSKVLAKELPVEDRVSLLADLFEASKAGYSPTVSALAFLQAYDNEEELTAWDVISSIVGDIKRVMDSDDVRDALKPLIRDFVSDEVERLGWEKKDNERHTDSLLRPLILGLAAGSDTESVVKHAQELFNNANKPSDILPDLRGLVYVTAARKGGRAEFNKLLDWFKGESSAEEKDTLMAALTAFEQPDIIGETLNMTNSSDIRLQDVCRWLAYSAMNRHSKEATWHWAKEHWAWLEEYLGSDMSFSRLPVYLSRSFSEASFLKEYDSFFNDSTASIPERSIKQGREQVIWQSEWRKRDHDAILSYLRSYNK